ncbi:MAG TPA: hypothetical protein H9666_05480 [Firmicutes bacterium]|nr:hypothetical protein [Bacillota bacterium]
MKVEDCLISPPTDRADPVAEKRQSKQNRPAEWQIQQGGFAYSFVMKFLRILGIKTKGDGHVPPGACLP